MVEDVDVASAEAAPVSDDVSKLEDNWSLLSLRPLRFDDAYVVRHEQERGCHRHVAPLVALGERSPDSFDLRLHWGADPSPIWVSAMSGNARIREGRCRADDGVVSGWG